MGESKQLIIILLIFLIPLVSAGLFEDMVFEINGTTNVSYVGTGVHGGYDFNGDGYKDLLISAGEIERVYLFYGASGLNFNNMTVTDANVTFRGTSASKFGGVHSVGDRGASFIGDFNNDTYDDVMISAPYSDVIGRTDNGQVFVFFGTSNPISQWSSNIANLTINGTNTASVIGTGMSGVRDYGDFNGDGISDILITNNATLGTSSGVHVIFGVNNYPSGLQLRVGGMGGEVNVTLWLSTGNNVVYAVSPGDVNNDTFDDILLGSPYVNGSGFNRSGQVHLFYGSAGIGGTNSSTEIANLTINGTQSDGNLNVKGYIGDFNNDTFDDIVTGYYIGRGEIYMFYGANQLPRWTNTSDFNVSFQGTVGDTDFASVGVGFYGDDINGDGVNDAILGDPRYSGLGTAPGNRTKIILGVNGHTGSVSFGKTVANITLNGTGANNFFGSAVTTWDYDNDTYPEIVVGDKFFNVSTALEGQVKIFDVNDIRAPSLVVISPVAGQNVGTTNLTIDIAVHDSVGTGTYSGLGSCWFTNVTGTNETFSCLLNTTTLLRDCTTETIYVFVNDTLNNINQTGAITFDVSTGANTCSSTSAQSAGTSNRGTGGGQASVSSDAISMTQTVTTPISITPEMLKGEFSFLASTFADSNEKFMVNLDKKIAFKTPINIQKEQIDKVTSEVTRNKATVSFSSQGEAVAAASLSFVPKHGVSVPSLNFDFKSSKGTSKASAVGITSPTGAFITPLNELYPNVTDLMVKLILVVFVLVGLLFYGFFVGHIKLKFNGIKGQMFVLTAIVVIMMIWMVTATYNSATVEIALEDFNELSQNYMSEKPKVENYAILNDEDRSEAIALFSGKYVQYVRGSSQPNFGVFNVVKVDGGYEIQNFLPGDYVIKLEGNNIEGKEIQLNVLSHDQDTEGTISLDVAGQVFYNKVKTDVVNFDRGYAKATMEQIHQIKISIPGADEPVPIDVFRGTPQGHGTLSVDGENIRVSISRLDN